MPEPFGPVGGGELIAMGTPETIVAEPRNYTGQFLKELLGAEAGGEAKRGGGVEGTTG